MRAPWAGWTRWFVGAAALAVATANLATAGKVTDTAGYQALRAVEAAPADRPMILLVGSSLTQHGIDKPLLQRELARRGFDVELASLAFGGMIKTERHFYLREIGRLVRTRPAAVFFETSAEYDWRPFYSLARNARTTRAVAMMDWRSAVEALWWLLGYSWDSRFSELRDPLVRHYLSMSAVVGAV